MKDCQYIAYNIEKSTIFCMVYKEYSASYEKYLEFIEEDVQKGTLLSFSRVKEVLEIRGGWNGCIK